MSLTITQGIAILLAFKIPLKAQNADPTSAQASQPPLLNSPERVKQLMENPNDKRLWGEELQRLKKLGEFLDKLNKETEDRRGEPVPTLAVSNNAQLQGIAFRHLGQYPAALDQLDKSRQLLGRLELEHHCANDQREKVCAELRRQQFLLFTYFTNVYIDMGDSPNVVRYLELAARATSDVGDYAKTLRRLASWCLARDEYESALDHIFGSIEAAMAAGSKDLVIAGAQIADSIYREVFRNISWKPGTSERRTEDPAGFADSFGLGIGRPFKYGMSDPSEDDATFATLFFTQEVVAMAQKDQKTRDTFLKDSGYGSWERLQMNVDIEGYVRQQMGDGVFEAAAKYIYYKYIDSVFYISDNDYLQCQEVRPTGITVAEITERLAATAATTSDPNTRRMIRLLDRGHRWLIGHCHNKHP